MTERITGERPDGLRVRRVHIKPGVVIRMVPPGGERVLDREAERARRNAALGSARDFFHANAEGIALLMGGGVEDRDSLQLDSGDALRSVTLGLMAEGIGSDEVVRDVQRSILARPGMIDSVFASDTARSYGRLLTEERDRVLEERIAQEGAPKPAARRRKS